MFYDYYGMAIESIEFLNTIRKDNFYFNICILCNSIVEALLKSVITYNNKAICETDFHDLQKLVNIATDCDGFIISKEITERFKDYSCLETNGNIRRYKQEASYMLDIVRNVVLSVNRYRLANNLPIQPVHINGC